MNNSLLSDWLQQTPCLLADGATGTNLFGAGLNSGDSPELWNIDHPHKILAHHQAFVAAGADIILTNSFGGTRQRLKLHQAEHRVAEINYAAARLAKEAAATAGRKILVGGSIGPTGDLFAPLGPLTHEEGVAAFLEQAQALRDGGADLLWIETMSAREEVAAAAEAAIKAELPYIITCSFDTNGRTMMGLTPAELSRFVKGFATPPLAYGANCGIGAAELVVSILQMKDAAEPGDILIAKGNCGVPYFDNGQIKYDGTPELMADYAEIVFNAGARIIGGCCGTTYNHVSGMRKAINTLTPGPSPTIADITAALGDLSSGTKNILTGHGANPGPRRTRRRGNNTNPAF